jgi:hypothetical protein
MTWHSIPYEPRKLTATEARLDAIYAAARKGLKGDTLALASGMLPSEYRQLCQFDPLAELAELKGRADGEMEISSILHDAAAGGDAKAALEILKHVHGWVAKQQINVDVEQRISITGALEMAERRVLEGVYTVIEEQNLADDNLQLRRRNALNEPSLVEIDQERPIGVRPADVPVGREGDAA